MIPNPGVRPPHPQPFSPGVPWEKGARFYRKGPPIGAMHWLPSPRPPGRGAGGEGEIFLPHGKPSAWNLGLGFQEQRSKN